MKLTTLALLACLAPFAHAQTPAPVSPATISVAITWPLAGENIGQISAIYGTASATVATVNVSLDGAPICAPAAGTASWLCALYAKNYTIGAHTLTVTASDAANNSASASVAINVFHSTPVCAHSQVGTSGFYCEQALSAAADRHWH